MLREAHFGGQEDRFKPPIKLWGIQSTAEGRGDQHHKEMPILKPHHARLSFAWLL